MTSTPSDLDSLMALLSRLPGVGRRSARRVALHLLKHREDLMRPLAESLTVTAEAVKACSICGNLDTADPCRICTDERRERRTICVVEDVGDLWAIDRTSAYSGQFHVLGGTLSALDGIGPSDLNMDGLFRRVAAGGIEEVILATNATVDGQTTAHYLTERLQPHNVKVTRLAHGVPLGGELDYLDDGTLTAALSARTPF